jgi:hypothetical protein
VNIKHLILPATALGAAATLLLPAKTEAFATLGFALPTTQRDFRVFNNFTDPEANNNAVADTNFPGYTGAVMALWKGCIEWGSVLHGNGNGDPHQPAGLGSGGANFDANFQALATGIGGTNDNIMSELAGSNGGVLAFTEAPGSTGWRIRFYSGWIWQDGPGTSIGGAGSNFDLQSVTCHEYGHALGMDHSAVGGTTMAPAIAAGTVAQRSIAADDIAGIQSIYLVAAATKPRITGVSIGVGTVTLTGTNFGATGNQVWFTQATAGGTGVAVMATNVSSTGGGTSITCTVPANAGPGDVMVKLSTAGNATLSNAWPINPNVTPPCDSPVNFCQTSPNSVGDGSVMTYSGTSSVSANDLELVAYGNPPDALGRFFYGMNQTPTPLVFGNGWRCIDPFTRLPTLNCNEFGDASFLLDLNALVPPNVINAGETWSFQFWYRNPAAGGANFNASDGLQVEFCP